MLILSGQESHEKRSNKLQSGTISSCRFRIADSADKNEESSGWVVVKHSKPPGTISDGNDRIRKVYLAGQENF